MFRIGCAGEITPRHIIRTEYVDDEGKLITSDELLALNNRKTATKSTEYYEEILYKFLRIVFLK